jgi:dTDP-4-dehydrorhamnose reductase
MRRPGGILILGATGLVGRHLVREFHPLGEIIGTSFKHVSEGLISVDIANGETLCDLYHEIDPWLVLLPAAIADVDYCERNPERSWVVNVQPPVILAELCARSGAKLVFFSTDYVFSGDSGPYSESDRVAPVNIYGKHKLAAEQAILDRHPSALIIRTSLVYGERLYPPDPIARLVANVLRGERQGFPADQWSSPTDVGDLCSGVRLLVGRSESGIFHLAGPVRCSRLDYARAICKIFGGNPELIFSQARHPGSAPRPHSCGLRIEKAQKIINYRARHYLAGLAELHGRSCPATDLVRQPNVLNN